eukprot:TRINITY_DN24936_c0_g1_i2.p1 TRINITY_DN24936_c0_g1~~TRINITY_DN24936_c0_g1_i2.p1  ORF type:complete len:364 (+),score=52.79 TRINITY_DN24936_c0_g1_i2:26-1093(+)
MGGAGRGRGRGRGDVALAAECGAPRGGYGKGKYKGKGRNRSGGKGRGKGQGVGKDNCVVRENEGEDQGEGSGKGQGQGAAAAAVARSWSCPTLAQQSTICAYVPCDRALIATPEIAGPRRVIDCSVGSFTAALLSAEGEVLCQGGNNNLGQLGVGDRLPHAASSPALLPWPAAAVCCGAGFCVALSRGGDAVCSWGWGLAEDSKDGGNCVPDEVPGLPLGDPVVLLRAGLRFAIAVTKSGEAYGWGRCGHGQLALPPVAREEPLPVRIPLLSGRWLRRLACGAYCAFAETGGGELLGWGCHRSKVPQPPTPLQPSAGSIAFPLQGHLRRSRNPTGARTFGEAPRWRQADACGANS